MKYCIVRKKRSVLIFVLSFMFLFPSVIHAATALSITEIMFDPAGTDTNREWIEVNNGSSSSVDLTKYYVLTDGAGSTRHSLVAQGLSSIDPGGYAVIAQDVTSFKKDFPSFTGLIYDSAWSGLTATVGKTLLIVDSADSVIDQVTYDPTIGGVNDGNSLQCGSTGNWLAGAPTPGSSASEGSTTDTTTDTTTKTTTQVGGQLPQGVPQTVTPKAKPLPHADATILVHGTATTGIPFSIGAIVHGSEGELRTYGLFRYALGDGTIHESRTPEKFEHTYAFPGTYVLTFMYSGNYYQKEPDQVTRTTIEVVSSVVTVSSVRFDGSVELSNTGSIDTDLSDWRIESMPESVAPVLFQIPTGTMILAGKSIVFPGTIFGGQTHYGEHLRLLLPSGTPLTADLPVVLGVASPIQDAPIFVSAPEEKKLEPPVVKTEPTETNLTGNALGAMQGGAEEKKSVLPFVLALGGLVGGAVISLIKLKVFEKRTSVGEIPVTEAKVIADSIRIIEE